MENNPRDTRFSAKLPLAPAGSPLTLNVTAPVNPAFRVIVRMGADDSVVAQRLGLLPPRHGDGVLRFLLVEVGGAHDLGRRQRLGSVELGLGQLHVRLGRTLFGASAPVLSRRVPSIGTNIIAGQRVFASNLDV